MRRVAIAALILPLVVAAGCLQGPAATPTGTASPADGDDAQGPGATPTPTEPAESASPADSPPSPTEKSSSPGPVRGNVSAEYLLAAGDISDRFESVTVTLEVTFAEREADLRECVGLLFGSRWEPTPTPLPTPVGGCHTSEPVTVDLTELEDTRSIGVFTADGRFDGAHALVVRDVVPRYANGTAVTDLHDPDFRASHVEGPDGGRHVVTIGVTESRDSADPWKYVVSHETSRQESEGGG